MKRLCLLVVAQLMFLSVVQAKDKTRQYEKAKVKAHNLSVIGGSAYGRLCQEDFFNLDLDGWAYLVWSYPKCDPSKFQKVDPFPADYVEVHRASQKLHALMLGGVAGKMVVLDKKGNEHIYQVLSWVQDKEEAPLPQGTTIKGSEAPTVPADSATDSSASSMHGPSGGGQPVNPQSQRAALALGLEVKTSEQGGVEIVKIDPDGAAALAGLQVGYVITSVDGKRITGAADFAAALANQTADSKVGVGYMFHSNLGWMSGAEKVLTMHQ